METTWELTFLLTAGLIVFIILAAYLIAKRGVRNAALAKWYESKYKIIDGIISNPDMCVCEANYDWICKWMDELRGLPYKNQEMTDVLDNKFRDKFKDIILKRKVEEMI